MDSNLFLLQSLFEQWKYREQYERAKDKFTLVLDTPEYETHKRSKKISDVSFWAFFPPIKVHSPRLLLNLFILIRLR